MQCCPVTLPSSRDVTPTLTLILILILIPAPILTHTLTLGQNGVHPDVGWYLDVQRQRHGQVHVRFLHDPRHDFAWNLSGLGSCGGSL